MINLQRFESTLNAAYFEYDYNYNFTNLNIVTNVYRLHP